VANYVEDVGERAHVARLHHDLDTHMRRNVVESEELLLKAENLALRTQREEFRKHTPK
jgi:hypothetical protein